MTTAKKKVVKSKQTKAKGKEIKLPFPYLILSVLVLLVYAPSFQNGFTELDDKIFIVENSSYNEDLSNLGESFKRGVFSDSVDTYYRPLLLDSFILNYQLSGTDIGSYHAVNIFLHLIAVLLLFLMLKKLNLGPLNAFLLSVLFAVHPVLSQAVSWVPGRNDSMLAIFSFLFMICAIQYIEKKNWYFLFFQFIALVAAFFTKETAVFIPPALFILLILMKSVRWKESGNIAMLATWLFAFLIWFFVRSQARIVEQPLQLSEMFHRFGERVPLLLQYAGKIVLPVNLSVFPMIKDTAFWPGIVGTLVIAALIYFSKNRNNKIILAGIAWFVLLLIPIILLPSRLNDQDFEHRLYLPIVGVLIILSQTALFKNLKQATVIFVIVAIAIIFSVININHQKNFKDPLSFWSAAVESTPHSSYATMMYASRLDAVDKKQADALMLKAYELNPKEKYINYYLGKMYLDRDSMQLAEKYFHDELNVSSYYETYFHLSRIEFEKGNLDQSIVYMEKYLSFDPNDAQAANNYVLLLLQNGQKEKARNFIKEKQKAGLIFSQPLIDQVK